MPHVNCDCAGSIPFQDANSHNIVQPRICPIRARLELASQHGAAIWQGKPFGLNIYIGAIVGANIVARVRSNHPLRVGETPVCAQ